MEETKEKKQKKGTTETTGIHSLPDSILAEILSRVPAKTVFRCMTVCKPWRYVIDNPFLRKQHLSNARICPLLIIDPSEKTILTPINMHLVEGETLSDLDRNRDLNSSRIEMCKGVKSPRTLTCSFKDFKAKSSSCEGIICSAPRGARSDHVIICNPITGQYLRVEIFKVSRDGPDLISYFIGLGFSPTDTVFKLLRVSRTVKTSSEVMWWPELCRVGTKVWQRVEVPSMPPIDFAREVDDVIYVNGVIYWTYRGDASICSFDFGSDEFQVLPLPEIISGVAMNVNIGVLGGSLCVSMTCPDDVNDYEYEDEHVELWIIEKDGRESDWRNILDIDIDSYCMERCCNSWTLGCFKAIKYLECGKILLHDERDTFLIYDPVTNSNKFIRVLDDSYLHRLGNCFKFQVVPHVPSLVSLRDALKIEDADCVVEKYYPRVN